jgi:urease accessory protein
MISISQRIDGPQPAVARLVLPFDTRSRSRFRAELDTGEPVAVMMARGQVLRGGDRLLADDGRIVEIVAAAEKVTTARAPDSRLLARAAFHLGNRHVGLQLGEGWLRYSHDHVLDEMVVGLGLQITVEDEPFEPEAGAYTHHGAHHRDSSHRDSSHHDSSHHDSSHRESSHSGGDPHSPGR